MRTSHSRLLPAFFLLAAVVAFPQMSAAQIPVVDTVPGHLRPILRVPLEMERLRLVDERIAVLVKGKSHNSRCSEVRGGSPEEQVCSASREAFAADLESFSSQVKVYREMLKTALAKDEAIRATPGPVPANVRIGIFSSHDVQIVMPDGRILSGKELESGSMVVVQLGSRMLTGPNGHLKIMLLDETIFTLGPDADMEFDDFVYDPDVTYKKVAISVAKGAFRYVTSKVVRNRLQDDIKVRVKSIAIGIRGTDVEIVVDRSGSGYIKLFEGELLIRTHEMGGEIILKPGKILQFDKTGKLSDPINFDIS